MPQAEGNSISAEVTPEGSTVLTSPDGRVSVELKERSVSTPAQVVLESVDVALVEEPPEEARLLLAFRISMRDQQGRPLEDTLRQPAIVEVTYTPDDLEAAEGDTSKLYLSRFDDEQQVWGLLPSTIDPNDHTISARSPDLGMWGAVAAVRPAGEDRGAPIALWVIVGGAGTALAAGGLWYAWQRVSGTNL